MQHTQESAISALEQNLQQATHKQTIHTQQEHKEEMHIAPLQPEVLFKMGSFPVTNTLVTTWVAVLALVLFAFWFRKKIALVPGKLQSAIEMLIEAVLDFMSEIFEDRKKALKYFPFVFSLFVFIAFVNLAKFIPGLDAIYLSHGGEKVNLFRPAATDLNVTLALAIITMVVVEASGIAALGLFKYGKKFINFSSPLAFVIGLIELVSEFVRLVAFSFRLFGNIFAGKILLAIVVFFLPYIVPVPLMIFEIFVGFVQAAIFALLALLFIKLAMEEAH